MAEDSDKAVKLKYLLTLNNFYEEIEFPSNSGGRKYQYMLVY